MRRRPAPPSPRIGIVSLGCPKALVDSERITTRLRAEGYAFASRYEEADLVLVNTCGFIDSAKEESLAAIAEALRANGRVIVTGCMGAEAERIRARFPGVLAITGPHQYEAVVEAVHRVLPKPHDPIFDLVPPEGIRFTPRHYAWLKIAEGCNHRCTFCIIPKLRGPLASRSAASVLHEAERLVRAGVRELLVIAQDVGAYGVDLGHAESRFRGRPVRAHIRDLCAALAEFDVWVRLHYVYPYPHIDDLLPLMAEGRILPYLDIPFQHASPSILKAMRRPAQAGRTLERIRRWREICPELVIRSTFVVGFPGETEDDFRMLLDWLAEAELDRVGCFAYEDVEGAAANRLAPQLPEELRQERRLRLLEHQAAISRRRLERRVGVEYAVLVDRIEDGVAFGRTYGESPEIDGIVHLRSAAGLSVGDLVWARILAVDDHDLFAAPLTSEEMEPAEACALSGSPDQSHSSAM